MKYFYILTITILIVLSACTAFTAKDRAAIKDAQSKAEQALDKANEALEQSRDAKKSAEKSARKADIIFKESQTK